MGSVQDSAAVKKCDNCPIIDGECNQAMCDQTQANYKRMSQTAARKVEQDIWEGEFLGMKVRSNINLHEAALNLLVKELREGKFEFNEDGTVKAAWGVFDGE